MRSRIVARAHRPLRAALAVALVAGASTVALSQVAPGAAAHPTYVTVELQPPGTFDGYAAEINDAGTVVVYARDPGDNTDRMFSWNESTGYTPIPGLGGPNQFPRDLSEAGHVIGGANSAGSQQYQAFVWSPSWGTIPLGTLGGGQGSDARAVNDFGTVVGASVAPAGVYHAFMWTQGTGMVDIGPPGHFSFAWDVNNAGTVVYQDITAGRSYARLADGTVLDMGTLGASGTRVLAINEAGAAVGYATVANGDWHPFLWTQAGGIQDLGSFGGTQALAEDINENGEVVGRAYLTGDNIEVGFYWSASTGLVPIDSPGSRETEPNEINESGQVTGYTDTFLQFGMVGFLWSLDDGLLLLDNDEGEGINNSGEIVGRKDLPLPAGGDVPVLVRPFDPDADADGLEDAIEVAGVPGAFDDHGGTTGAIVTANGLPVTITDAAAPDGVRIVVGGSGTTKATFNVCGFTLRIKAGSEAVVTCGSITVDVVSGAAEVELADGAIVVDVPAGATAKVSDLGDGSYHVEDLGGTGDVTVTVDGNTSTVNGSTTVSSGDSVAPTVVCAAAPAFLLNQPGAAVTATVTDADSGPASATASTAVSTASVGTFTAVVTGHDLAGNPASATCGYSVGYRFGGFAAPIDNLPTINSAKAGQTIPVKWRVADYYGVGVSATSSFVSVTTTTGSCSASAPFDAVETYTGNSGLQYLGDGNWQFNWKTPKTYAGLCRQMQLNLADSSHAAAFSFK